MSPEAVLRDGCGRPVTAGAVELGERMAAMADQVDRPFAPRRVDLVARFAAIVAAEAGAPPDARALAFWLRPTRLAAIERRLGAEPRLVRQPRGLVVQWMPANVGSLFAYTWTLSFLLGNATVVRRSRRTDPSLDRLLAGLRQAFDGAPDLAPTTVFVEHDNDIDLNERMSEAASVRMIFGGDSTVAAVRALPTASGCVDAPFPDRVSVAALSASVVAGYAPDQADALARRLVTDVTTLGGAACSSPRSIVWCGPAEAARDASEVLHRALGKIEVPPRSAGESIARLVSLHQQCALADAPVEVVDRGPLCLVRLDPASPAGLEPVGREGVVLEWRSDSVVALARSLGDEVQTLAVEGLTDDEVADVVAATRGGGVQRITPIGSATGFDDVWDGTDLLGVLTRTVPVPVTRVRR